MTTTSMESLTWLREGIAGISQSRVSAPARSLDTRVTALPLAG